jgi:hypothetical protein
MLKAGRSAVYVFAVWGGIALTSALAALIGYVLFEGVSPTYIAAVTAVAGGAVLAMIADTMIPEAFEAAHEYSGLVTVAGFFGGLRPFKAHRHLTARLLRLTRRLGRLWAEGPNDLRDEISQDFQN